MATASRPRRPLKLAAAGSGEGRAPMRPLEEAEIEAVLEAIGAVRLIDLDGGLTAYGVIRGCTPAKAAELLALRPDYQRRLDERHADRLKSAMESERYVVGTGSIISFSRNCDLVDGQHRLTAQVKAGITLDITVCVVPDDAFAVIDAVGKQRTLADLAAMESNGEVRMAPVVLAGLVWDSVDFDPSKHRQLQRSDRARAAVKHPQREFVRELYNTAAQSGITAGMIGGACMCHRINAAKARELFFSAFRNEHISPAAKALADWIYRSRRKDKNHTIELLRDDRDHMIHAWNAHVTGKPLQVLRGTVGGVSPTPVRC